jgi:hypothetical protein
MPSHNFFCFFFSKKKEEEKNTTGWCVKDDGKSFGRFQVRKVCENFKDPWLFLVILTR